MCALTEHPDICKQTIQGVRESFDDIEDDVVGRMNTFGYDEDSMFSVRVAIEEAFANALLHGHRGDESKTIEVHWCVTESYVEFMISDQGRGFDPSAIPDPTADENLTIPSGRGLAMMNAFMDEIERNDRGNTVRMKHVRKEGDSPA